jgi:HEAT repeat protein
VKLREALERPDVVVDHSTGRLVDLGAPGRVRAVRKLDRLGTPAALHVLIGALGDPSPRVRAAALGALSRHQNLVVARGLLRAVLSWPADDPAGREDAEEVLTSIPLPRLAVGLAAELVAGESRPDDPSLLRALLAASPDREGDELRIVILLVDSLDNDLPDVRANARVLLEWFGRGPTTALLLLLEQARHPEDVVLALGATGDHRAVPELVARLEAPEAEVRGSAATALGEVRATDPPTVAALLTASDDDEYEVRSAAIAAMDRLGPECVPIGLSAALGLPAPGAGGEAPALPKGGPGDETQLPLVADALDRLIAVARETAPR